MSETPLAPLPGRRDRWQPWAVVIGGGWVAAVVLAWVANQRDLPGCRTEGFFEARDAISQLFYLATVSGVVAVVASIAATAFCPRLRSVFVLVLFVSLLLTAFCFIGAVGTGLSCALD